MTGAQCRCWRPPVRRWKGVLGDSNRVGGDHVSEPNAGSGQERGAIRVMVVEDHQMVAGALRVAIGAEGDMEVVAMASTMAEALEMAKRVDPEVVVVDYRLPDGDASELVPALFEIMTDPRVLVISGWTDDRSVARAVEAGASGFLPKQQPVEEFVDAVRRVAAGEAVFAPALLARLIGRLRPGSAPRAAV